MHTNTRLFFLCLLILLVGIAGPLSVSNAQNAAYDWEAITQDVGRYHLLTQANENQPPRVFLIQESHNIVSGQVESAVMIHRLVRDYGLRLVAVEGAFPLTSFDTSWFGDNLEPHTVRNIAVQLLGEGEINQGELAALVYPKYADSNITAPFDVFGFDDEGYYDRPRPSDDAYGTFDIAMVYVAVDRINELDSALFAQVMTLLDNVPPDDDEAGLKKWREEFYDVVFTQNPDSRIQDWYAMGGEQPEECMTTQADEDVDYMNMGLQIIRDNQVSTETLWGIDLAPSIAKIEEVRDFYVNAHERELTMVYELEGWLYDHPDLAVAAIIGAAHTGWMEATLEADGYNTVVLSSESLCDDSKAIGLTDEEYSSIDQGLSVDVGGGLGQVLHSTLPTTPIKPPIVLNEPWFQVKATAMSVAALATEAFRANPAASLEDIFGDKSFIPGVTVNMDSLEQVSDDPPRYVFSININIQDIPINELHIGVLTDFNKDVSATDDLETLLLNELGRLRSMGHREEVDPATNLSTVAPNVSSIFSSDRSTAIQSTSGI